MTSCIAYLPIRHVVSDLRIIRVVDSYCVPIDCPAHPQAWNSNNLYRLEDIDNFPEYKVDAALLEAAKSAGLALTVESGSIFIEL